MVVYGGQLQNGTVTSEILTYDLILHDFEELSIKQVAESVA